MVCNELTIAHQNEMKYVKVNDVTTNFYTQYNASIRVSYSFESLQLYIVETMNYSFAFTEACPIKHHCSMKQL